MVVGIGGFVVGCIVVGFFSGLCFEGSVVGFTTWSGLYVCLQLLVFGLILGFLGLYCFTGINPD